jgi:ribose transport system substrate-binding protein
VRANRSHGKSAGAGLRSMCLVTALVSALAVGACGDEEGSGGSSASAPPAQGAADSGGSAVVAEAKRVIAEAQQPINKWTGPTEGPPPAKGKTIYNISCSPDTEGCQRPYKAAAEAAKALGWEVHNIQTKGTPDEFVKAMNQAMDGGADGILAIAFPIPVIQSALQRAANEGVWFVDMLNSRTAELPSGVRSKKGGLFSEIDTDNAREGALAANWIIAETDGKANVGIVEEKDFPVVVARVNGFNGALGKCGECKVAKRLNVPVSKIATELAPSVSQFLSTTPDANYLFPAYGGAATFAAQGVRDGGSSVPIATTDANSPNLEALGEGQIITADAGAPLEWVGWAAIDDLNRAFNGEEPAPEWAEDGGGIPVRLITEANAPGPGENLVGGSLDYEAEFKNIWGIG